MSALDAVFTDLNGDGRPDLAVATSSALQILLWSGGTFHLTSSRPIVAPDALTASDLNGDGAADLYVVTGTASSCHDPSTGGDNCPDMAFVNSGGGSFTPIDVSGVQTSEGQGDAAVPIAYSNANGTALIVLNGGDGVRGPVQLLTFELVATQRRGSTSAPIWYRASPASDQDDHHLPHLFCRCSRRCLRFPHRFSDSLSGRLWRSRTILPGFDGTFWLRGSGT